MAVRSATARAHLGAGVDVEEAPFAPQHGRDGHQFVTGRPQSGDDAGERRGRVRRRHVKEDDGAVVGSAHDVVLDGGGGLARPVLRAHVPQDEVGEAFVSAHLGHERVVVAVGRPEERRRAQPGQPLEGVRARLRSAPPGRRRTAW